MSAASLRVMMRVMDRPVAPPSERVVAEIAPPFEQLYRERFAELARLASLVSGDRSASFDIVQDAFVQLYRRWDIVDEPIAYLRRSVVNACHTNRRRIGRRDRAVSRLAAGAPTDLALGASELNDVLAGLPAKQRSALVLRHYFGLPDAEIAAAIGCAPATVASLIHRGLARLREVLAS